MPTTRDEYNARRKREQEKALAKYGEAGLEPGGNPDLDVLDYTINEVVGLYRYGEMIFNRREEWPPEFRRRAAALANQLREVSAHLGQELIALHLGLQARVDLGRKEGE